MDIERRKERERDIFRSKRKSMSKKEVLRKSRKIQRKVESLPEFKDCENFSSYIDKKSENEVRTEELVRKWLGKKKTLVPYVHSGKLKLSPIWNFDFDLNKGSFGVLEPRKELKTSFPLESVELILVPGLAFDEKGNRLGYGGGYYDGLLRKIPKNSPSVGLAFESQISQEIPHDKNDEKVDIIVTENEVKLP
ncbi:MAG: 5-formyltetrahydrofolate cyclo-ligase [Candidatus Hadarchaeota archaeon]